MLMLCALSLPAQTQSEALAAAVESEIQPEPQTFGADTGANPLSLVPRDRVLEPKRESIFIGFNLGLSINSHGGTFALEDQGRTCCDFNGGGGLGASVALRGEYYPVRDEQWGVAGRLSIEGRGGSFESSVTTAPMFGQDNLVENVAFQNDLDVSLTTLDISGLFLYKIGRVTKRDVDIYAAGGPSIWFNLSQQFDKTTRIVRPSSVTYLNGATSKSFDDLDVDFVNGAGFGIMGGGTIRYELANSLFVGWELLYRLPFTDIAENGTWSVSNLLLSVGIARQM